MQPEHSVLGGSHAESLRIVATPEMLMYKTETEATRSLVLFSESLLLALYIANDCVFQNSFWSRDFHLKSSPLAFDCPE